MYLSALILFMCSMIGGYSVILNPNISKVNFRLILAFSGAFLFATTVLHLLPESLSMCPNFLTGGLMILIGFYFQILIEFFSEGVEHGHIHIHQPNQLKSISLIIALMIHALLEGMIISHDDVIHHGKEENNILIGLIIHKVPETIALVSVLIANQLSRPKIYAVLIIFSVASPAGVFASELLHHEFINFTGFVMALVAGNFLYISTTIFYESNPDHKLDPKRILSLILGGLTAIGVIFLTH